MPAALQVRYRLIYVDWWRDLPAVALNRGCSGRVAPSCAIRARWWSISRTAAAGPEPQGIQHPLATGIEDSHQPRGRGGTREQAELFGGCPNRAARLGRFPVRWLHPIGQIQGQRRRSRLFDFRARKRRLEALARVSREQQLCSNVNTLPAGWRVLAFRSACAGNKT